MAKERLKSYAEYTKGPEESHAILRGLSMTSNFLRCGVLYGLLQQSVELAAFLRGEILH